MQEWRCLLERAKQIQAREARQLSVGDVAQILKISYRQVQALEDGNWSALPGQTFVLGFVRNYARFLRLDGESLLQRIKAEQVPETPHIVLTQVSTAPLPDSGRGKRRDLSRLCVAQRNLCARARDQSDDVDGRQQLLRADPLL